jgi:DNA-directed RNA polymerase specialized sigma24 family protein
MHSERRRNNGGDRASRRVRERAVAFGVCKTPDATVRRVSCGSAGDAIDPNTPETLCAPGETEDLIRAAIGGLMRHHQAIILARYYDGLSFDEIGNAFGVTKVAAFKMHARAIERLKVSLELMGVNFHALSFSN